MVCAGRVSRRLRAFLGALALTSVDDLPAVLPPHALGVGVRPNLDEERAEELARGIMQRRDDDA